MDRPIFAVVTLLLLAFLTPTTSNPTKCRTEMCAQQLMETMDLLYRQSALEIFQSHHHHDVNPELLIWQQLLPFLEMVEQFEWSSFQSPLLRRQFEILIRELNFARQASNKDFVVASKVLRGVGKHKFMYHRRAANKSNPPPHELVSYVRNIKSIITNSNDLQEVKWYWREWRNRLPMDVKNALNVYIQYYQNMSTVEKPASSIWYAQYEDPKFMEKLEKVMEAIMPLYQQLHGQLRQTLWKKYGDAIIPSTGLIPHHLMEQALYEAWKKDSVFGNPYPDKKLPNLKQELDGKRFAPLDFITIGTKFFERIGFDRLTENFLREHFRLHRNGGPDCKSALFTAGEIHMKYCPSVSYKKLLTTHGDITHMEYAILRNNMRVGLNQEACPGFGNAMAEAVILSVSTPKHLQQHLNLLNNYTYDDEMNMNFLYRMAVHALLSIPTYLVHEKLWTDILDKKVDAKNINCHYWNLMEKYMGVGPSLATNNKKLFGEFLGYEIYRDICLEIGQYQRGNKAKPLFKCDFAENQQAGQRLRNMMNSGSAKPWHEIIKEWTSTQPTKLNASPMLEYYEPLTTWMTEYNRLHNITVGWQHTEFCH
uniref:Angiotensin-converting enzyme n=1 Tax=Musca domestica TaxID=7370 RepID=A0A1I8MLX4_MUSDO